MKEYPLNYNHHKISISKEEELILKIAIEEYKELFPRILEINQLQFMPTLEKYIKISLIPKNMIVQSNTLNKILQIIRNNYYEPEYDKIHDIIQSITDIKLCEIYNGKNFIKHCNNNCQPIHSCGKKMYILDKLNYLLCLKCHKIYHNNFVLFHCSFCKTNYYTSINMNNKEEIYKLATWEKYHCNAFIDDIMKCVKCRNPLYINIKTEKLNCLKCHLEYDNNLKFKCIICYKEFTSTPKEYNPNEFKLMKIIIKDTIYNGKDAKPEKVPCCNLSKDEIMNYKFVHKKECNGNLYEGEFNKKKIVVCEKCHMLNFYENFKWMCPICKVRFLIENNNDNENNNENNSNENGDENIKENNKENINENNENNYNDKSKENNKIDDELNLNKEKEENIFKKKSTNHQRKINRILRINTSYNEFRKELSNASVNQLKKFDEIFHSTSRRGLSTNNLSNNIKEISKVEHLKTERNKNLSNNLKIFDLDKFNLYKNNVSQNIEYTPKKLSNININLNVNVNINDNSNNIKIPYPYKIPNSKINSNYKLYNRIKLLNNNVEENKKFSSDDYNIISQIGEGTFGKIYQVEGLNKKKYAMKKILANSMEDIKAIESEYKMLNDLSPYNLNLVKIYGIETKRLDKTTYVMYVLMDLAIRDWEKEIMIRSKQKNYYKENELIQILKELIHTFAELQKHKISHRDIKPQNILLFNNNTFKISDFGEAKKNLMSNNNTITQTIRGTELYMSPILFKAIKVKNCSKYTEHNVFKSDVFSLGLCLLFASTLTFNSLYEIRELNNTIQMKLVLMKYLKNRYSSKLTDILFIMLEIDEKFREDFIQLDNRIQFL